ncbi:hypothetical protein GCM10028795_20090 [Lysobacter olei]
MPDMRPYFVSARQRLCLCLAGVAMQRSSAAASSTQFGVGVAPSIPQAAQIRSTA